MTMQIFEREGKLLTDSRDIAKMISRRHSDLLDSIDGYVKILADGNFRSLDFFTLSSYVDAQGEGRRGTC